MAEPHPDDWLLDDHVRRHVFLSAHFDDVAFSCGGTVARLAAAGRRPIIVVVFAAAPEDGAPMTAFAHVHDAMWGIGDDPATSNIGRQAEEQASARLLGATVRTLPFRDAIYRADRYEGNERLFGAVHPDEWDLPVAIAATLAQEVGALDGARVYVPLAVGRHVDHQLVFRAGQVLAGQGADVWVYEDLPYSLRSDARQARRAESAGDVEEMAEVSVDAVWASRIAAVMAHTSQLASAFGYVDVAPNVAVITDALARFALSEKGSVRTECFSRLRPA